MTIRAEQEYRDLGQISKSLAKSADCETYFANYILAKDKAPEMSNALADTGTAWHKWRAWAYERMVNEACSYELHWNQEWLAENAVSEDARKLIASDWINVDHEAIAAYELFLSVDRNWQPLDSRHNSTPGYRSPNAYAGGTLDLLTMPSEDTAFIIDGKTTYSTSTVFTDEGVIYALLVFLHYPGIQTIHWQWEFPRLRYRTGKTYRREQIEDLKAIVDNWMLRAVEIQDKARAGKELEANPFASSCPGCQILCKHRQRMLNGPVFKPPTNAQEAQELAGAIRTAEIYASNNRTILSNYLSDHGAVECNSGYTAEIVTAERNTYPAQQTLEALGCTVTPPARQWDLDLSKLPLSASTLNQLAKAKKRHGMYDVLNSVAVKKVTSRLKIGRAGLDVNE